MSVWKPLKGQIFSRLTVLEDYKNEKGIHYCKCECSCPNHTIVNIRASHLTAKEIVSCGCLGRENSRKASTKHGFYGTRFYKAWRAMKGRCTNNSYMSIKNYKSRGITYCKEWEDFINFKNDMYESYLKHIKEYGEKDTSLDRIDNNKGYYKENCRWATRKIQQNNRRGCVHIEYKGETKLYNSGKTYIIFLVIWCMIELKKGIQRKML